MIYIKKFVLFAALAVSVSAFAQTTRITLSVPGPGAASYLPIELIPIIGADRAEGAEVQVNFVPGGGVAISELQGNNADFAVVGLPAAMSARLKDPRIVALAAVNDLPLYVLLVRAGLRGKVKTIADLKGRTMGVHSNSATVKTNSHQLLELALSKAGVPPTQYRVVAVGQRWESERAMLANGDADAVMGDEPHATRMIEKGIAYSLLHLGDSQQSRQVPGGDFLRGALVGRSDLVYRDPAKADVMVRVLRRVLLWMASHSPEQIAAKLVFASDEERAAFTQVMQRYPRQYSKDGKFSSRQLKSTETFFREAQAGNPVAAGFDIESMVLDRWAGRKE